MTGSPYKSSRCTQERLHYLLAVELLNVGEQSDREQICPQYVQRKRHLNFRHRASCILGQAFRYSPENAFYIFNQQIYFII